jgi:hypothetical protein
MRRLSKNKMGLAVFNRLYSFIIDKQPNQRVGPHELCQVEFTKTFAEG